LEKLKFQFSKIKKKKNALKKFENWSVISENRLKGRIENNEKEISSRALISTHHCKTWIKWISNISSVFNQDKIMRNSSIN
jgi:hypothetical protein